MSFMDWDLIEGCEWEYGNSGLDSENGMLRGCAKIWDARDKSFGRLVPLVPWLSAKYSRLEGGGFLGGHDRGIFQPLFAHRIHRKKGRSSRPP